MRVRCVRSFVNRGPGGLFRAAAGDEFEMPEGTDWLKAGFVVPVDEGPETAMLSPGENAMRKPGQPKVTARPADDGLEALTVKELYEMAQELDIEGRSNMARDELLDAIREALNA